jgi:hypothetical protein
MPSIFQKIQSKLELYRLEKRYTRNRDRRTTFISNATYVDGEYVYNTPNNTGSSTASSTYSSAAASPTIEYSRRSLEMPRTEPGFASEPPTLAQRKKLNRFSSMPGFGFSYSGNDDWRAQMADLRKSR